MTDNIDSSWSPEQLRFIDQCIERHGHKNLWNRSGSVSLTIQSMTGLIPTLTQAKRFFQHQVQTQISPRDQKVEFTRILNSNDRGLYHAGNVSYESTTSQQHRKTFSGLKKYRPWSVLDTLYFFGYALTTYYSVPSILPNLKLRKELAWQNYRGFEVEFPEGFDTHSQVQTFFFDNSGLLYRHDYKAEILNPLAYGSHFTTSYFERDAVQIAHDRKVFLNLFGHPTSVPVLEAKIV